MGQGWCGPTALNNLTTNNIIATVVTGYQSCQNGGTYGNEVNQYTYYYSNCFNGVIPNPFISTGVSSAFVCNNYNLYINVYQGSNCQGSSTQTKALVTGYCTPQNYPFGSGYLSTVAACGYVTNYTQPVFSDSFKVVQSHLILFFLFTLIII